MAGRGTCERFAGPTYRSWGRDLVQCLVAAARSFRSWTRSTAFCTTSGRDGRQAVLGRADASKRLPLIRACIGFTIHGLPPSDRPERRADADPLGWNIRRAGRGVRLEQHLFGTDLVRAARFRVRPDNPDFSDTGPIAAHLFVFPRTSVRITHAAAAPVVADSGTVMFYNRGQQYRRDAISRDGDHCDFFVITEATAIEAVSEYDPTVHDRPSTPFPFVSGPCATHVYLAQRTLTAYLSSTEAPDPMRVEDLVLTLLRETLASAFRVRDGRRPTRRVSRAVRVHAELAEAARAELGSSYQERLTVSALAERIHTSPFHLSRIFRSHIGASIHQYLNQLRLRASLHRLTERDCDLTEIALDLGFASHSHFAHNFRRTFGVPPSRIREDLTTRRIRALEERLVTLARSSA